MWFAFIKEGIWYGFYVNAHHITSTDSDCKLKSNNPQDSDTDGNYRGYSRVWGRKLLIKE
jgi:hypothetical protein